MRALSIIMLAGCVPAAIAGGSTSDQWLPLFGDRPEFGIFAIAPYDGGFVGAGVDIAEYLDDGTLQYNLLRFWKDGEWTTAGSVGSAPSLDGDQIRTVGVYNRDVCIGGDFTNLPPDGDNYFTCWSVGGEFWYRPGQGGPNGPVADIAWEGGGRLYVAGAFTEVTNSQGDQISAKGIVETDGFDWSPLFNQGMIDNGVPQNNVSNIEFGGGQVYVTSGTSVLQWNRTLPRWDVLASSNGTTGLRDMAFFGTELVVAGGNFTMMDGSVAPNIAKSVPAPMSPWDTFDEAEGPGTPALAVEQAFGFLYSTGNWSNLGGSDRLARWSGAAWEAADTAPLGPGFDPQQMIRLVDGPLCLRHQGLGGEADVFSQTVVCQANQDAPIRGVSQGLGGATLGASTIAEYQGELFVGGAFTYAGDHADVGKIARWDGSEWHRLGDGISATFGGGSPNASSVRALADFGGELHVAGIFDIAGAESVVNLARWNGTRWADVGGGIFGTLNALISFGGKLYIGGSGLNNGACNGGICAWNGSAFEPVGGGIVGDVNALVIYQGDLVAAGSFSSAGGVNARGLARWDGTSWSAVGGGVGSSSQGVIDAVARGNDLYVGGNFQSVGSSPVTSARAVARWNGSSWSALGTGIEGGAFGEVRGLALVGGAVYATGNFDTAGGLNANSIARWTGSAWEPVGLGLREISVLTPALGSGNDLHVAGDGRLYVAGNFKIAGTRYSTNLGAIEVNILFADGFEPPP